MLLFDAVLAQRFDQCADDPPQLEHRLRASRPARAASATAAMISRFCSARSPRIQPIRPVWKRARRRRAHCADRQRRLARRRRGRLRLAIGLEIEQQQRAFRQQRAAAHRAQIVQQRQQHQRQIAAAGEHALQVAGQLHHRAHQRIERLGLILALAAQADQVARDLLHLLGQQRRAVDLQQRAARPAPGAARGGSARAAPMLPGCSTCASSALRPSASATLISRATVCSVCVASSVMLQVQWLTARHVRSRRAL